jgi:two-component system chemotaxis response regulator CheB
VPNRNIVVIGGSAGAAQGVANLLSALPGEVPAVIFLVLHIQPTGEEWLVQRFSARTFFGVISPTDEEPFRERHVYVARPDHHLIVKARTVRISRGPRENMWRPAIDVLFRSAAVAHGARVIGVLMSGELDDGTAGLQAIKKCGGKTVIQDPQDALYPGMPRTAAANVEIDHCVPLPDLPSLLTRLVNEPADDPVAIPASLRKESLIAEGTETSVVVPQTQDAPTPLSCPECNGPLWRTDAEGVHFSCRVGHAYHMNSLVQGSTDELDRTLWAAIRLFEQRANIARMMADQERARGNERRAGTFIERAAEAQRHAQKLRELQVQTGSLRESAQ